MTADPLDSVFPPDQCDHEVANRYVCGLGIPRINVRPDRRSAPAPLGAVERPATTDDAPVVATLLSRIRLRRARRLARRWGQ